MAIEQAGQAADTAARGVAGDAGVYDTIFVSFPLDAVLEDLNPGRRIAQSIPAAQGIAENDDGRLRACGRRGEDQQQPQGD